MIQPPYILHSFTTKRIWAQYQKLLKRLQSSIQSGRFQQFSKTHQQQFIQRLKRYINRLSDLTFAAKKVAIGSSLLLTLLAVTTGNAQVFVQPPCSNSLGSVDVGNNSYPVLQI